MRDKPVLTYSIIALNTIVFVLMFISDWQLTYPTLVNWGAKINYRIVDFYWWHLITPAFLHGSIQHLLFNNVALYYFGPVIEYQLGRTRYAISYLLVGVIATIGSFVFTPNVSLGASGVIYGFMAYHLYLYMLNRELYVKVFGNSIVSLIVVNLIFTIIVPNIDIAGHIFGLLGGFVVYTLMATRLPNRWSRPVAIGLLIAIIALFSWRMVSYRDSEEYYYTKAAYYQAVGNQEMLLQIDYQYREWLAGKNQAE